MRDIPSVSGRMGKGLQWEAAAVEAGVLPAAVRYCTAAPTQAPWTRRHPGCPAPSGQRRLWQRREYYVLHTRYRIPGLQQGKLRQLWVSHFNHQALLSCLPPPLLAQVWSCQASFIPGYLLYPWGILKICGLPPALWASPLSHGCLFCLNITKQRRHEEKQIYSHLPWKPAQRVNNRREGQVPMDPEDPLGSNCCDISVLHNPSTVLSPARKKREEGKTDCLVFKMLFPGTLSWIFWSLWVSMLLPLLFFHLPAGGWLGPWAVKKPSQCPNAEVLPSRNTVLSNGGGIVCVLFTWRRTESTALLIAHSRTRLGNLGLGFCSQRRDRDANRARLIASGVESSQS